MRPARVGTPFEVIEPQFVFQLAVLLFDGPAAARQTDQRLQRGRCLQIEDVVLPRVVGQRPFEEDPALAPPVAQADPTRDKAGGQRTLRALPPPNPAPSACREAASHRLETARGGRTRPPRVEQSAHRHRIPQALALQAGAEGGRRAVVRVGHDGVDLEAGRADLAHVAQGNPPLRTKAHRRRHPGLVAALGIGGPLRGKIDLATGRPHQRRTDQRGRHADLTVAGLAQRAAVLPFHADRLRALFGKARIVDGQDAPAFRNPCAQARPHRPRGPRRIGNEMLQRLIAAGVGQPPMHRLHGLARAVVDKAGQVATGRVALDTSAETASELVSECAEALQDRAGLVLGHACDRREFVSFVQVRIIGSAVRNVEPDKVVLRKAVDDIKKNKKVDWRSLLDTGLAILFRLL